MAIRIAARAILLHHDRLLLVNAWPGRTDLWCAPGGGVHTHDGLAQTLVREVHEETGLTVRPGAPCLVNEFHDPHGTFHQVEVFFRCTLLSGDPDGDWTDPERVVTHRRWLSREALADVPHRPRSLGPAAWGAPGGAIHDPLEAILR